MYLAKRVVDRKGTHSNSVLGLRWNEKLKEIDMTNSGNYKINKKKRAKSLKEKAKLVMGHTGPAAQVFVSLFSSRNEAEWRPLRNVRIMMKKNSSVCRGIAFIDFPSVVAAQKMMDEIGDCGLDVNGLKLSFEYRLGKISELASEDPIVKAGAPDSRDPAELRMLKVGDEPYESYSVENNCVLFSLVRSAKALEDTFNSLEGVTCEKADEGLYLFPRIQFPQKAVKAADAAKIAPDAFYAKRLVQATGIVVLPGSDFGQVPGIWCIGLPILLQKMEIPEIITGLTDYHQAFMAEFHD
ncbi:hypothetical protein C5167_041500 [Papaver somniferum]|nr:hypothetical protein C5167_041500 [Papaver somniferum]